MSAPSMVRFLGDLVLEVKTWNPAKSDPDALIDYIDISSIDQETKSIKAKPQILASCAPSRARQLVQFSDILVSTVRPGLNAIAQVPSYLSTATASTGFCVLRPKPDQLENRFLFHWLKTPSFVDEMVKMATGASYPAISDRIILESKIPLPPLSEQKRIAAILDKADELREKRRQALAKLDTLTQSLFLEMFGDPTLDNTTANTISFGELTTRITYGFTCPMEHLSVGKPIITAKNIRHGFIDFEDVHRASEAQFQQLTDKCKPQRGDLLITKDGAIRGRCALVNTNSPFCISQAVALIRPNLSMVTPDYLWGYIVTDRIQKKIMDMDKGVAMPHLQITELAKFPVSLPPMPRQREYADQLAALSRLKAIHNASISKLDTLFASLQHRAFRGEL